MQHKWAQIFWQDASYLKNADFPKWNIPQECVDSKRSRANNKPTCIPASSPTNLPSKKLPILVKIPPDTSAENQMSGEKKVRPSQIQEWKCIHFSRADMNVFQDTKACCWDHLDILLNFLSMYIHQAISFLFLKKSFLQLWHIFTKVTFCFLASFSRSTGNALERSRNCSVCASKI